MAFQFKNKETKTIYYLNEIDEIAANFWGKEIHPKFYATPSQGGANWFDVLGRAIENLQYFHRKEADDSLYYHRACSADNRAAEFEMNEVAPMILCNLTRWNKNAEEFISDVDILKPYVELCFHLHSLGIIGVGCGW
jgi:hypothetical protein